MGSNLKTMTSENSNSLPKEEAIEQLRKTIGQLETIIEQLDKTSVTDLPDSTAIENLISTTTDLEKVIPPQSPAQSDREIVEPEIMEKDLATETTKSKQEEVTPLSKGNDTEPVPVESEVKTEPVKETPITNTPQKSNQKKWIIIGVVAALVLTIISLSWIFLQGGELPKIIARYNPQTIIKTDSETTEIAQNITEETPSKLDNINSETKTIVTPEENVSQPETEKPETIISNEIPSELETESRPQKVAIETVKPTIKLSPEQNLVAAIERAEHQLADRYNEDLIISIKPNFTDSIVTVTLADDWYQLAANSQDRITEEMLKRSRQLEFNKLKITDTQNNLIARSPIVGDNIVIFRRSS